MKNFVKNVLKRQALAFSQTQGFKEYLKLIFEECCEDRVGVSNSEVYTIVLSLYLYVAHRTNVISGTPPSKKVVQEFILVADKNFDGVVSFDEIEVVALLLCEHCAFQISAYWFVTYLITPFVALACFHGMYLAVEWEYVNMQSFFATARMTLPGWMHFFLDEKLLFLFFVPLLNYGCVPRFSTLWVNFLNDSLKSSGGSSSSSSSSSSSGRSEWRGGGTSGIMSPLEIPHHHPVDSPPHSPGKKSKRKTSIYDIYDSDAASRCSTPILTPPTTPVTSSAPSARKGGSPLSSPSDHCTAAGASSSPSYPISYAQFQFVSNKEDTPSPNSNGNGSGSHSGSHLKQRRRSSAPPEQLRGSLPSSLDSSNGGGSGSKSKAPTVFKKLRSTFSKKSDEGK